MSFFSYAHLNQAHARQQTQEFVWPVSGGQTPDLPQSSAYGPRLQAGDNFEYDYHQGMDIPVPTGTILYAVTTGTVRIAGSHSAYQDGVVQLDHGNNLYSNYLHITASLVTTGEAVAMGQAIALSGVSSSGFPHLHFELRQGGYYRLNAVNPHNYLPYPDTLSHTIAITDIYPGDALWVQITAPSSQLDVNQITMTLHNLITHQLVASRTLDYEARNRQYDGDPLILDNPDLDNILIQPQAHTTSSTQYVVDVKFHQLIDSDSGLFTACALDVKLNKTCDNLAYFHFPIVAGTN